MDPAHVANQWTALASFSVKIIHGSTERATRLFNPTLESVFVHHLTAPLRKAFRVSSPERRRQTRLTLGKSVRILIGELKLRPRVGILVAYRVAEVERRSNVPVWEKLGSKEAHITSNQLPRLVLHTSVLPVNPSCRTSRPNPSYQANWLTRT